MDHICSVTHHFSRSTYVSGTLCKCHHRLQSLEEWGLSLLSQSSFIPGDVFILEKIPWLIILRNHLLRRKSHHLYFPHLWPLGRFLVLFKAQLKHLLSTIIAQRSSLTSFEISLFLSWCLHTWQIITLCVLDQIVNFSTSGIILYLYFHPCIRNTEVKW